MSEKKARHFHAGKLRKEIDGVEYVEVAESKGKVFVADTGMVLRNGKLTKGHDNGHGYRIRKAGGMRWRFAKKEDANV